jgi:uroporphyrinogen-III synthase
MRVIVTRPASDAPAWVQALQHAGHVALSLPLIDIQATRHTDAVKQAWTKWPTYAAAMFVSAQAVRFFFQHRMLDLGDTRCWATGPGTRQALVDAGVAESLIDSPAVDAEQFDSEALWQVVQHQLQPDQRVLIVRGSDGADGGNAGNTGNGRDWLAQQLAAAGAHTEWVAAYERTVPRWTPVQSAQAQAAATDGSVWVFSSSQAIVHLQQCLPQQSWAQSRCLATHERIAQTAHDVGFGQIIRTKPRMADVLACLESLA